MEERQRLTVRLPRAVARDFKARAASKGYTMQELVEKWIERFLWKGK
jgi:hypothetical protein